MLSSKHMCMSSRCWASYVYICEFKTLSSRFWVPDVCVCVWVGYTKLQMLSSRRVWVPDAELQTLCSRHVFVCVCEWVPDAELQMCDFQTLSSRCWAPNMCVCVCVRVLDAELQMLSSKLVCVCEFQTLCSRRVNSRCWAPHTPPWWKLDRFKAPEMNISITDDTRVRYACGTDASALSCFCSALMIFYRLCVITRC